MGYPSIARCVGILYLALVLGAPLTGCVMVLCEGCSVLPDGGAGESKLGMLMQMFGLHGEGEQEEDAPAKPAELPRLPGSTP